MSEQDRRNTVRVRLDQPVVVYRRHGSDVNARCDNLSIGGTSLLCETTLYQGEPVLVEMRFLQAEDPPPRLPARVRYVVALTHPSGWTRLGLQFDRLSVDQRDLLERFLNEQPVRRVRLRA